MTKSIKGGSPKAVIAGMALAAMFFTNVGFSAPAPETDIVDTAAAAGSFKTLGAALKTADLVDTLKGAGPFTVFAPTDEAFSKLPAGTLEDLLKPENKAKLQSILKYHVVSGRLTAMQVEKLTSAQTLDGQPLNIRVINGTVTVNNATVTQADIQCTNGVIHVIDTVLLPQ